MSAPDLSLASGHASVIRLAASHLRASPRRVLAMVAVSLILAASAVLPSVVIARVVDKAIGGRFDVMAGLIAGGAIVLLAAWDAGLTLARRRLALATEIAVRADAASRHFRAAVRLPLREYAGGNEAALIRSFDDLDRVVEFIASRSVELLAEALIVASSAALMLIVEWRLALIFLVLAGLSLATAAHFLEGVRKAIDAWLPVRDRRFAYIVECVTSMLTIKTLSAHQLVMPPFEREQALEQEQLRTYRVTLAQSDAAARFWGVATPGVGTVCGAVMLIAGTLSAGDLLLFLSVSAGLGGSLGALHSHMREWQEARSALDRMRSLGVGRPEPLEDDPGQTPSAPASFPVKIEDLGFRHAGAAQDTLGGLELRIAAGEHVAIVGRSGEGKTTLAHLLARLHDPDLGSIAVGAETMPLDRHRRAVLLVPHIASVFNASVRDNVRLWDETIGDATVWQALEQASLRQQVMVWAEGLDAPLGANGNPLSAGQQQRLALARVFTRRPEVLILDEATSALDARTEREVLDNLRIFMRGRVMIVITHRDAVAATFDRVLRVVKGRVEEDAAAG